MERSFTIEQTLRGVAERATWRPSIGGTTTLHPESKAMRGGEKNRGPVFEAPDVPDSAYPDGQIADKTIADLKRMKEGTKAIFSSMWILETTSSVLRAEKVLGSLRPQRD